MSVAPKIRSDWLKRVVEPILEPNLPICDAHHHLWAFESSCYEINEYHHDIVEGPQKDLGHNVVSSVAVECTTSYSKAQGAQMRYVGESVYINSLAEQCRARPDKFPQIAAAIIARADLDDPGSLQEAISAHKQASPTRFRGFRHATGWDVDPLIANSHTNPKRGLLLDPAFQRGAAILAENDLIFETVTYHEQLDELATFARSVPNLKIVLNHLGGIVGIGRFSGKRTEVFVHWTRQISALSACPNVFLKLGGTGMTRVGFDWHTRPDPPTSDDLVASLAPYYQHAINCFGPDRCMFESNFPVDKISCSYHVLWNAFKKITLPMSAGDKRKLFRQTAESLYDIQSLS